MTEQKTRPGSPEPTVRAADTAGSSIAGALMSPGQHQRAGDAPAPEEAPRAPVDARAPAETARVLVGVDEIVAATTALSWAARWDTARRLLASAQAGELGDAAARRLTLAAAATAVHHDFRTAGDRWAPAALATATATAAATEAKAPPKPAADITTDATTAAKPAAESTAEDAAGAAQRWSLDFLALQHEYGTELAGPDATPVFGPDGRDPARLAALARQAEALLRAAGDVASAGWAAFYRGLIADNLIGDRADAHRWFDQALEASSRSGDDYLAGEALRHLGDFCLEAGDLAQARARWERSAQVWAGIGNMTGVLAQQLLLAQLAIAEGRTEAGTAIAAEVSRWSGALGLVPYQQSADALVASLQ